MQGLPHTVRASGNVVSVRDEEHGRIALKVTPDVLEAFNKPLSMDVISALLRAAGLPYLDQNIKADPFYDGYASFQKSGYLVINFTGPEWVGIIHQLFHAPAILDVYGYVNEEHGLSGELLARSSIGHRFVGYIDVFGSDRINKELSNLTVAEWSNHVPEPLRELFPMISFRTQKQTLSCLKISIKRSILSRKIVIKSNLETLSFLKDYLDEVWRYYKYSGFWLYSKSLFCLADLPTLQKSINDAVLSKSSSVVISKYDLVILRTALMKEGIRQRLYDHHDPEFCSQCDENTIDKIASLLKANHSSPRSNINTTESTSIDRLQRSPELSDYFWYLIEAKNRSHDARGAISSINTFLCFDNTAEEIVVRREQLCLIPIPLDSKSYIYSKWKLELSENATLYQYVLLIAVKALKRANIMDNQIFNAVHQYGCDTLENELYEPEDLSEE